MSLYRSGGHDHDQDCLLPHHLPEVGEGSRQRALGGDEGVPLFVPVTWNVTHRAMLRVYSLTQYLDNITGKQGWIFWRWRYALKYPPLQANHKS